MIPLPYIIPLGTVASTTTTPLWELAEKITPISVSINEDIVPVSTATLVMPLGEELITRMHIVQLFTPNGETACYRIRSMDVDHSNDTVTYQLDHMFAEVGDFCVMAKHTGNYAAATAIRRLWRGADASSNDDDSYLGGKWVLGDLTALSGITVEMNVGNRTNLLTGVLDIMDGCPGTYLEFDFSEYQWTVNVSSMDNAATQDRAFGRLSRNVASARVSFDYTDLCTRVRYYYDSWHMTTASEELRRKYGLSEVLVSTSGESSLARAQYVAKEYLRKNQEPHINISIDGADLSSITGETFDKFKIGKLFTLYVPELDTDVTRNITRLSWPDVYGDPTRCSITLGEDDPTLWAYLKSIKKK